MEQQNQSAPQPKSGEKRLQLQIDIIEKKLEALRKELIQDERRLERVLTHFLGTALALAAAILWRDAIISSINKFLPSGQTWEWQVMAAILFTLIASILILVSSRWSHRK